MQVVEMMDIAELSQDPANVNTHNEDSIAAIMRSLKEFGQQKPILVDKNNVVRAGNGVLLAAMRLCWRKIQVVRTDLAGPKLTAYAIADNRTAELSMLDGNKLNAAIADIQRECQAIIDRGVDGMSDAELAELSLSYDSDINRLIAAMGFDDDELKRFAAKENVFAPTGNDNKPSTTDAKEQPKNGSVVNYVVVIACSDEESQKQTFASLQAAGYQVTMAKT